MKKINVLLIAIALLFTACAFDVYEYDKELKYKDFLQENKFEFNLDDWEQVNEIRETYYVGEAEVKDQWVIFKEDDKLMVSEFPDDNETPDGFRFDVDDGYFIGTDHGEFGGNLAFFNNGIGTTVLNNCNPQAIFSINNKLYMFEGCSHGVGRGALYSLTKSGGKWKTTLEEDFGGEPQAFVVENNTVYVVINTYNSKILKLTFEGGLKIETLIQNDFRFGVYATSAVKEDNLIYFGLMGGLAIFDLDSNELGLYSK